MQGSPAVCVDVQIFSVGEYQVELVALCHVADDFIKQLKALLKYKPRALFSAGFVEAVKQVKEDSLTVCVAVLYFDVAVQRRVVKYCAVVDQRPASAAAVLSRVGMAVFALNITDCGVSDMGKQDSFVNRLSQPLAQIVAL